MTKVLPRLFRFGIATLIVVTSISASAADGKWNADAADNWSTASRWTNSQIADGVGSVADFSFNITAARTVTLNGSRTVGRLRFEDSTTSSHDWTLGVANNAVLTLQVDADSPVIDIANRTVTSNPVLAGTQGFTRIGGGTLQINNYNNTFSGNVSLTAGATRLRADGTLGQVPGVETPDAITLSGSAVLMNYETDVVLAATRGITLGAGGGRIQAGWSRSLTINGPITGDQGLTINSDATPGLMSLNGVNTFTGPTAVTGWLQVNRHGAVVMARRTAASGALSSKRPRERTTPEVTPDSVEINGPRLPSR
jgi:autotransporter-associated beta strand protein